MKQMDDDELYSESEYELEDSSDPKVEQAKDHLTRLFHENPEEVYFERQLEVLSEDLYFHWITARAVKELLAKGSIVSHILPLTHQVQITFLRNKKFRYWRRKAAEIVKIV